MRKGQYIVCALTLMSSPASAEDELFRLNLSQYPVGKLSVQPDYSTGKQTMALDNVIIGTLPDTVHKYLLMSGGGSSFTDFFVSRPAPIADKVVTATWSGKWYGVDATSFTLGGGHFEGIAGIKFDKGKLYLVTDAGAKEIGPVKVGASYRAFLTVSYADGSMSPTARLRYIEQTTPTQSKAYGPVSIKFTTAYDALASKYITFLAHGENAVAALNTLTITTGSAPLRKPVIKLPH